MREYESICNRLEDAMQSGLVSVYTDKTILEMSEKVLEALTVKYSNIRKGVKSIMGGKVLEYEAKRIMNEGRAEGRENVVSLFRKLFAAGRMDDIQKAMEDTEYMKKMMQEFSIG